MKTFEEYKALIDSAIAGLALPEKPEKLYQPITYTLGLGGKRLRPMLTLAACELFGGDTAKALNAALAVEIFHNFTLLHDDIMDEAPLRRGKATVYKKWNPNVAILSGDTMFALAYRYLSADDHTDLKKILDTFTQTAIEVCEGQQFDMDFEQRSDVSIPEYLYMIRMKTAVLLGASLKIGAMIANADEKQASLLYDFGVNAGMAFQLKDDLLDAFGHAEKFGKTIGGDILANKKTYLYLKCIELAVDEDKSTLEQLFSGNETMPADEKIEKVLGLYNRYQVREATVTQMEQFFHTALNVMKQVDARGESKNRLTEFAAWLYRRDH